MLPPLLVEICLRQAAWAVPVGARKPQIGDQIARHAIRPLRVRLQGGDGQQAQQRAPIVITPIIIRGVQRPADQSIRGILGFLPRAGGEPGICKKVVQQVGGDQTIGRSGSGGGVKCQEHGGFT